MYSALDVAKYIVDYTYDHGNPVSNLRLQKILYFVQAEFLVSKGRPCFQEKILAWNLGPVVREVYHEYRIFGSASIASTGTENQEYNISTSDRETINGMVDQCDQYSTPQLVEISHEQDPWKEAIKKDDKIISNGSIKEYFERLQ